MKRACAFAVVPALLVAAAAPARAQEAGYFKTEQAQPLTYRLDGERTTGQKVVIASLGGAAVVAGVVGLLFHLESKQAADDVTAYAGEPTGRVYTPEVDARRRDALRYRTGAAVSYGVGGALLIGAVVAFIVTHPADQVLEYESSMKGDSKVSAPFVEPVRGGAVLGGAWAF